MKTLEQIAEMRDLLEANICEHGWDASVDGASTALEWVLDQLTASTLAEAGLRRFMSRPDAERRHEWIARGGDPKDWP